MNRCLIVLAAFIVLAIGPWAEAWSSKEHILLTRIAAERLIADPATPPAVREWLHKAARGLMDEAGEKEYLLHQRVGIYPRGADGLAFWSVMPDLDRGTGRDDRVQPFGVSEALLHYIDLELLNKDPGKVAYADDLSHKPALADLPRDMKDPRYAKAGMLPFRVEDCCKRMAASLRAGKLYDAPGQYPRDDHAAKWAGYLAHYAADSTQPQHATADYRSASYFAKAVRAPNVHSDMEYRLVDDDAEDYPALREELWQAFVGCLVQKAPATSADPWQGTVETCLASYDALPLIGKAAVAAYGGDPEKPGTFNAEVFFHFRGRFLDRDMTVIQVKAHQWAFAVQRIQSLWLTAWKEAEAAPASSSGK